MVFWIGCVLESAVFVEQIFIVHLAIVITDNRTAAVET